jgi:HSP20 family protein
MMARSAADVMWADALALLAQADHQRREFFRPGEVGWEPPIDVLETEVELVVVVALPGVRPNEVEVVIGGSELAIVGTRRWPASLRSARVHRMELPHGRFERRLGLPPGTFEIVRHDLVDGCLTIALRKLG